MSDVKLDIEIQVKRSLDYFYRISFPKNPVCKYLRDFNERMEGTPEGMSMAIPPPQCEEDGKYKSLQCSNTDTTCNCVNDRGVVLKSGLESNSTVECQAIREQTQSCKHLYCNLYCPYGYEVNEVGCERCRCHKPCQDIICRDNEVCTMIHVNCTSEEYCPAVPVCLTIKPGQCPYLIPHSSDCTLQCRNDYECASNEKCCSNGCGTQCVIPIMATACEHTRAVAEHRARESGEPARRIYIPACEADGTFKQIQCHNSMCWCVDQQGIETPGTRVPFEITPHCDIAMSCPKIPKNCLLDCPNGFQLDANTSCPICSCYDPCKGVTCRGENEACRMVEVACSTSPCPPLPVCLPKKANPCPVGSPLLQEDSTFVTCGPFGEHCPSTHKCELSPLDEYALCCPKPREVCLETPRNVSCDPGTEFNTTERWFFDTEHNECRTKYNCTIGHNDFATEQACNIVCPVLSHCEQLRENNLKKSQQLKKPTFLPRCNAINGTWKPVQCLEQVGICWCVYSKGLPVKGSMVTGSEPFCNFRQAREISAEPQIEDIEIAIQEMMDENIDSLPLYKPKKLASRCLTLKKRNKESISCDAEGKFEPMQCAGDICWCVNEAGKKITGGFHSSTPFISFWYTIRRILFSWIRQFVIYFFIQLVTYLVTIDYIFLSISFHFARTKDILGVKI